MDKKIILDLCGGTGAWSKPYKDAGYDVKLITLPKYNLFDVVERERELIIGDLIINADDVYGILCAPTCTMFSLARTTAKTPRDFEGGMALVKKCLEIVWFCRCSNNSKLKFWALENPMGYLRQFLGKPPYTFSPEDFGEPYSKKTDLWGYYNIPKGCYREMTDEEKARCAINKRILPELPEGYELPDNFTRQQARRSMTSSKFAEAFFKANK